MVGQACPFGFGRACFWLIGIELMSIERSAAGRAVECCWMRRWAHHRDLLEVDAWLRAFGAAGTARSLLYALSAPPSVSTAGRWRGFIPSHLTFILLHLAQPVKDREYLVALSSCSLARTACHLACIATWRNRWTAVLRDVDAELSYRQRGPEVGTRGPFLGFKCETDSKCRVSPRSRWEPVRVKAGALKLGANGGVWPTRDVARRCSDGQREGEMDATPIIIWRGGVVSLADVRIRPHLSTYRPVAPKLQRQGHAKLDGSVEACKREHLALINQRSFPCPGDEREMPGGEGQRRRVFPFQHPRP